MALISKDVPQRQDLWTRYWQPLSRDLLRAQHDNGRWSQKTGPGSEFATAMACLILVAGE